MNRFEAFETWCCRRMLKPQDLNKALIKMGNNTQQIYKIKVRQPLYLGHTLTHEKYKLPKLTVEWKL